MTTRSHKAGNALIVEPRGRDEGEPGERRTMFLVDPNGNALEFRSFKHPEHTLTA